MTEEEEIERLLLEYGVALTLATLVEAVLIFWAVDGD